MTIDLLPPSSLGLLVYLVPTEFLGLWIYLALYYCLSRLFYFSAFRNFSKSPSISLFSLWFSTSRPLWMLLVWFDVLFFWMMRLRRLIYCSKFLVISVFLLRLLLLESLTSLLSLSISSSRPRIVDLFVSFPLRVYYSSCLLNLPISNSRFWMITLHWAWSFSLNLEVLSFSFSNSISFSLYRRELLIKSSINFLPR